MAIASARTRSMTKERRMLVIDDHPQARRAVVEHFRAKGWSVASASDFKTALELATQFQPIVIISEVILADARGPHFVRALKTVVDHDLHIVAITDVPREHVNPPAFDMVFQKPADLHSVSDYIEASLEER